MQMPEMDGAQLAAALRRGGAEQPLILLTSLGWRAEDTMGGLFAACLTKPTKAAHLYEALMGSVGHDAAGPQEEPASADGAPGGGAAAAAPRRGRARRSTRAWRRACRCASCSPRTTW
jgi:hypothetical protein